jgi:uncharacterized protein (TIGR03546 family)
MGEALRGLIRSSSSRHRPWQLAAALAMGVLCGLLPKMNLTFILLGCLCYLLPIHVPLAGLTCVLASLMVAYLAPAAGRLGTWSLMHPQLREWWLDLDALPLVPWFALHNSVVHGSLLIGLSLWLPLFLVARPVARWIFRDATADQPLIATRAAMQRDPDFVQEIRPNVGQRIPPVVDIPAPVLVEFGPAPAAPEFSSRVSAFDPAIPISRDLRQLLTNCTNKDSSSLTVEQVVERASQIAHYVDELLTVCDDDSVMPQPPPVRRIDLPNTFENAGDNSRMRPNPVPSFASAQSHAVPTSTPGEGELLKRHEHHPSSMVSSTNTQPTLYLRPAGDDRQREALRYLLHHLKAFKDKV